MTPTEQRVRALELAIENIRGIQPGDRPAEVVARAEAFLAFLTGQQAATVVNVNSSSIDPIKWGREIEKALMAYRRAEGRGC